MTARILIHPRCVQGPASAALAAHLEGQGYDIAKVVVGPPSKRGFCELVRVIEEKGREWLFERMNGERFTHISPDVSGPGRAA